MKDKFIFQKTAIGFLIGLTATLSVSAQARTVRISGSYRLSGECESQIWKDDGQGGGSWDISFIMSTDNTPRGLGLVSINNRPGIMISRPASDSFGGCSIFKSLMDCPSSQGTFLVENGVNPGPFHAPAMLLSFACRQR